MLHKPHSDHVLTFIRIPFDKTFAFSFLLEFASFHDLCFREGGGEELACYCRGEGRRERKAAKGNNVIHSHILENRLLESKRLVRSDYA